MASTYQIQHYPSMEMCSVTLPKQETQAQKCTHSNISTRRFATEFGELLVRLVKDGMLLLDRHFHGILMRVAMEASVSHADQPYATYVLESLSGL